MAPRHSTGATRARAGIFRRPGRASGAARLARKSQPATHLGSKTTITIDGEGGVPLSADVYVPDSPRPESGFPAILFINSWACDQEEYRAQAKRLCDDGYLVVSYAARGWGKSGGSVEVAGHKDVADIRAVVDWVVADGRADPSRIGVAGISYGGGLSLLGLAHDDRIKTAAAMSGWADLREAFYAGRSPRLLWGAILLASGELRGELDPGIEEKWKNLLAHEKIEETLAWALERSPVAYLSAINDRQAPVYVSQNLGDPLFQPNSVIDLYTKLTGPKSLDLNQGSHATAEAAGLLGAENHVWSRVHAWFDHWLRGAADVPSGVRVESPDEGGRWPLPDWPDTEPLRESFHLHPRGWFSNGRLAATPPEEAASNRIATGILSGANVGLPVLGAILDAHLEIPRVTWIPALNRVISCTYRSPSFSETRRILGAPKLSLWVEPSRPQFQLVAHLYEVDLFGFGRFITPGPVTRIDARPGHVQQVTNELDTAAHEIEEGRELALVIDTFDPQYKPPTPERYSVRIHTSPERPSVLTVPFLS